MTGPSPIHPSVVIINQPQKWDERLHQFPTTKWIAFPPADMALGTQTKSAKKYDQYSLQFALALLLQRFKHGTNHSALIFRSTTGAVIDARKEIRYGLFTLRIHHRTTD